MQVAKAPKDGERIKNEHILLSCTFTMVSLDPGTKKYVIHIEECRQKLTELQTGSREPVDCRDPGREEAICSRRTQL